MTMGQLTVEFAFEIGEVVYTKAAMEELRANLSRPRAMYIQERLACECPGGVQLYYYVINDGQVIKIPEGSIVRAADVREEIMSIREGHSEKTWGARFNELKGE